MIRSRWAIVALAVLPVCMASLVFAEDVPAAARPTAQLPSKPGSSTPPPPPGPPQPDPVLIWNEVALDAVAEDHSSLTLAKEQGGPCRTARALAMVHGAIFDAANSVTGEYDAYLTKIPAAGKASLGVAVAQSAHDVLSSLYPRQKAEFAKQLTRALQGERDELAKAQGRLVGTGAALVMLARRQGDGSAGAMTYTPSREPGQHRPDPLHPTQGFLDPQWGRVKPFSISSAAQFPLPAPPALTSPQYAAAFNEVKRLGSKDSKDRTADQTAIGIFWAYDGVIGLGTPPRLYNQVVRVIAAQKKTKPMENARLFALVNFAMADAGVAAWSDKYKYSFWRPIVAIREADEKTGPTGKGDGNPATKGDIRWTPLGAPASNETGTDFTPPFPAYASGHATFGAAAFHTVRRFFGTDAIAFEFVSDELNGETTDANGRVRPKHPRRYRSMSQAIDENAQSRIYLGIHWKFDATAGVAQGTAIAEDIFRNELLPKGRQHVAGK